MIVEELGQLTIIQIVTFFVPAHNSFMKSILHSSIGGRYIWPIDRELDVNDSCLPSLTKRV